MAGEIVAKNYHIGVQVPRRMPLTSPDKPNPSPGGVNAMSRAKIQGPGKDTTTVVVTRSNWRHKTKENPRDVELRMLLGGAFANL